MGVVSFIVPAPTAARGRRSTVRWDRPLSVVRCPSAGEAAFTSRRARRRDTGAQAKAEGTSVLEDAVRVEQLGVLFAHFETGSGNRCARSRPDRCLPGFPAAARSSSHGPDVDGRRGCPGARPARDRRARIALDDAAIPAPGTPPGDERFGGSAGAFDPRLVPRRLASRPDTSREPNLIDNQVRQAGGVPGGDAPASAQARYCGVGQGAAVSRERLAVVCDVESGRHPHPRAVGGPRPRSISSTTPSIYC
jgi:hypothetical protein